LQQGGLNREVASWLGSGSNMPVNSDQIRSHWAMTGLQQMVQSSGLPLDQLMANP